MTTNFTPNNFPAPLAIAELKSIIDGLTLPTAPVAVIIEKRETPDDEINSFLSDIRAAYNVLDDLEETARCFTVYQFAPALLNIERLDLIRDLYRFLSKSEIEKLIDYALGDIDHAEAGDTLDLFTFDETTALISDLVNPFIEPLDIKKYFDDERNNSGAFLLVEAGGPTLYVHWLDETGAYVTASGRTRGGLVTRRLDTKDLEIINELYFAGELNI
jgi:hypothetical protein|nr:MAG TPA: hypothetical protein [Bacteriophage sp.]